MTKDMGVSVSCLTYNHAKYLRQCLDGLVRQRTNFPFEIIIHDDASTDGSQEIIREYQDRYPGLIVPILQRENQYSRYRSFTHIAKLIDTKVRGKYRAFIEGDDYWVSPLKLQKQFDALEQHPECRFSVHKVLKVAEDGTSLNEYLPFVNLASGVLEPGQFMELMQLGYPFQTNSYFCRTEDVREYLEQKLPFRDEVTMAGDMPMLLYYGTLGKTYYIDEVLSHYRFQSRGSWSEGQKNSAAKRQQYNQEMQRMFTLFDEYSKGKYHRQCEECKKISSQQLGISRE